MESAVGLLCVELASKIRLGDEPGRLPKDRLEGASINLPVIWNGQRLGLPGDQAADFDVAHALRRLLEAEVARDL